MNKELLINQNAIIKEALKRLNIVEPKILFVLDGNKLVGSLTDGDVRRYLLSDGKITDQVYCACNRECKTARNVDEAKKIYNFKNYIGIPIVNKNNELIDVFFGVNAKSKIDILVVINAGGKGTRLRPITDKLPKPLIPVNDTPIIEIIMDEFKSYGCNDFGIIVNYKKNLIKSYFSKNKKYHINFYNEDIPLGTGGGLKILEGKIKNTFFFSNCDTLIRADYSKMLDFHKEAKNTITIVCASKKINIPYGVIETKKNGVVKKIVEKPCYQHNTNTGLYIVEPSVLKDIKKNEHIDFTEIIEREISKGKKVSIYSIDEDDWFDMGDPVSLDNSKSRLLAE